MAVTAQIEFDSVAGNVNDYYSELGNTITLSNVDDTGVSVWAWTLQAPPGSVAFLSSATAQSPTFVADKVGSYLVSLTVNGGSATDSKIYSILTDNTLIRIPAEGEIDESGSDGWSGEADRALLIGSMGGARGSTIIGVNNTGSTLTKGEVVYVFGIDATADQPSAAGLVTPNIIATYGAAVAFMVISATDGALTIPHGDEAILLKNGVLTGLTISGTPNVYISLGETAGIIEHSDHCPIGYALDSNSILFSPLSVYTENRKVYGNATENPSASIDFVLREILGKYIYWDLDGSDRGLHLPVVGPDDIGKTVEIIARGSEDYQLGIIPFNNTSFGSNPATGSSTAFVTLLKAGLPGYFVSDLAPGWTVIVSGQSRTVATITESDAAGAAGTTHWKVTPTVAFSPAPTVSHDVQLFSYGIVGNDSSRIASYTIRGGDSVTFQLWGDHASGTEREWMAIARNQENYDDSLEYFDKISPVKAHSLVYNEPVSRPDLSLAATYQLLRSDISSTIIADVTTGDKDLILPPTRSGTIEGISDQGKHIAVKVVGPVGGTATVTPFTATVTCVTVDASGWFTCLKADMAHPDLTASNYIGTGWLAYFTAASDMYHVGTPFEECDAAGAAGTTHWKITMEDHSWGYGTTPTPGQTFAIYNMLIDEVNADLGVELRAGPIGTGFGESAKFTIIWQPLLPLNEDSAWHVTALSRIPDLVGSGTPIGSAYPECIGQKYFATTAGLLYIATGLTDTDWTLV